MKLFSILVFAVHGVSGLLSETTVGNDPQKLRYIVDGKVIETAEQYAEITLESVSRKRGSSVRSFVHPADITYAAMYWLGLPNAREYLKAAWDVGRLEIKDGNVELIISYEDIFEKFGLPDAEEKANRARDLVQSSNSDSTLFFKMIESLLFVHGNIPFAEYSAIWKSATGPDINEKVHSEVYKILQQRPTDEKYYYRFFVMRYNDFLSVFDKSIKRPAGGAPGPARNHQQPPPYIFGGKVITNADEFAEAKLNHFGQLRRSSIDSFVQIDIDFAVMYRFGLPNAREYLKAQWDCSKPKTRDGRKVRTCNDKTLFAKFEIPDAARRAMQAEQMKLHFRNNKVSLVPMIEAMLFVHGKVPFAEYSAIWNAVTGRSDGPPESDYTRDQLSVVISELNKMLSQRPTDEKYYHELLRRFGDFIGVVNKSGKRSAEEAPGPAPAAKRARPTAVCQDAESSFQKLLCEHAKFQEEIASLKSKLHTKNQFQEEIASLKTELQTKNQEIGGLNKMCDHHNLVSAKLQSELQSKDQYHEKCQAELRAELQGKINALTAQVQQLQEENAGLRQQRPQVVIKPEPRIKQEVKREHFFDIKPEPQQ